MGIKEALKLRNNKEFGYENTGAIIIAIAEATKSIKKSIIANSNQMKKLTNKIIEYMEMKNENI